MKENSNFSLVRACSKIHKNLLDWSPMGAKLQPDLLSARYQITGLESGFIAVNGQQWFEPIVLSGSLAPGPWVVSVEQPLQASHFQNLIGHEPDILLIGTGAQQVFVHPSIWTEACREASVGIEFMTSAAACRTFNLLASENRRVVLATLLPGAQAPYWQPGNLVKE
jgi:uncharacterized protein